MKMKNNAAWATVRESLSSRYLSGCWKPSRSQRRKQSPHSQRLLCLQPLLSAHSNPFKSLLRKSVTLTVELIWQLCNWAFLRGGKLRHRKVYSFLCSNHIQGSARVGHQRLHLVIMLCYLCCVFNMITETHIDDPNDYFTPLQNTVLKRERMFHLISIRSPDKRKDRMEKKIFKTKCLAHCLKEKK